MKTLSILAKTKISMGFICLYLCVGGLLLAVFLLNSCTPTTCTISSTFNTRMEHNLGNWFNSSSEWVSTKTNTWTNIYSGMGIESIYRRVGGNFMVNEDDTKIAVLFSAEVYTSHPDSRIAIRMLLDGSAIDPSDIIFATGTARETRSFWFSTLTDKGLHTLEVQWLLENPRQANNATGYMRDASLLIKQGCPGSTASSLQAHTPGSGANLVTSTNAWVDIPGMEHQVYVNSSVELTSSLSAECNTQGGGTMFVRALLDDTPIANPSNVLFAKGNSSQARMITFGFDGIKEGWHWVKFQWLVQGGTAIMGDRTMVSESNTAGGGRNKVIIPKSGSPVVTSSNVYAPIPDMGALMVIPQNGEISVRFSAEAIVTHNTQLFVQLRVGSQIIENSEVFLAQGDQNVGVHSYVFSTKHYDTGGADPCICGVTLEWRVGPGGGEVSMGDRTMVVNVKDGDSPEITTPPAFGLQGTIGNQVVVSRIEPFIGSRNILAILWDPNRPGQPAASVADLQDALFGPANSVSDYYEKVSGGKFHLNNAGVLGAYSSLKDWSHYFEGHPNNCAASPDAFTSGHNEKWVEAIQLADPHFNFANYDFNGDGVLHPSEELAVVIIIPQNNTDGFVRNVYGTQCPTRTNLVVDGVIIPKVAEWYTNLSEGNSFVTISHELAHLLFYAGDMYIDPGVTTTMPGTFSLMDNRYSETIQHLDGVHKLALGWLNPTIIKYGPTHQSLEDVKLSQECVILPRKSGTDGKEYLLLENRQTSLNHPAYDRRISDSGIAVWHFIESQSLNASPPNCETNWAAAGLAVSRRGVRLIRPSITYSTNHSLWDADTYNLYNTGLICPAAGEAKNILNWADGVPAEYRISNFSASGPVMTFDIEGL